MVTHMKTTIEIAEPLLLRAKARAREKRITLRTLIEESLAAALDHPQSVVRVQPVTSEHLTSAGFSARLG